MRRAAQKIAFAAALCFRASAVLGAEIALPGDEIFLNPEPVMMRALAASPVNSYYLTLPSAETVQTAAPADISQLRPAILRTAFEVPGYVPIDPLVIPAPGGPSGNLYAYFTMVDTNVAARCRKGGWALLDCPAAREKRMIGMARFVAGGGWTVKGSLLAAKDSGDGSSPYAAAAIVRDHEVWLYYVTDKRDLLQPGLFRQKLADDGETRAGEPERLQFENAPGAATFERFDVVQLKCRSVKSPFVVSAIASVHAQDAFPFLVSGDGLHFRQESDSVVNHRESPLAAAMQLPVSSSSGDCGDFQVRHPTRRDIFYSERRQSGAWALKRASISVSVTGGALPGSEIESPALVDGDPAPVPAPAVGKCTPEDYLQAHPEVQRNPTYAQNPMLHYLVFGKDEGNCEPSKASGQ